MTLSQFWSSAGDSSLEAELEFHGLCAEPGTIALDGSAGAAQSVMPIDFCLAGTKQRNQWRYVSLHWLRVSGGARCCTKQRAFQQYAGCTCMTGIS